MARGTRQARASDGAGAGAGGQRGEPARPHGPMRGRVPERSVGAPRPQRRQAGDPAGPVQAGSQGARTYATYDLITACMLQLIRVVVSIKRQE